MRKTTIHYTTPLDALVAVSKRLSANEYLYQMNSEDFFDKYCKGQLSDDAAIVEWANDYRHYLDIRQRLERKLANAA